MPRPRKPKATPPPADEPPIIDDDPYRQPWHPPSSRRRVPYYPVVCAICYGGHATDKCNRRTPMQNAQRS